MGRQHWEPSTEGKPCSDRRHGHMTLGKVSDLLAEGKMEMVPGQYVDERGVTRQSWIPVARFVNARRWVPRVSGKFLTMQYVSGG